MLISLAPIGRAAITALGLNRKSFSSKATLAADSQISFDKLPVQALIPFFAGTSGDGIALALLKFRRSQNFLVNTSLSVPFL